MRGLRGGALLAALAACHPASPDREHIAALFTSDPRAAVAAVPAERLDEQVALGAALFAQSLGTAACSDCHPVAARGQDGRVHGRDTSALADVARQTCFGRDGAVATLPAIVRRELGQRGGVGDDAALQAVVARQPGLGERFARVHPGEAPTLDHAAGAIAAWLATWRTRGRWDRYVDGDDGALTTTERAGVAAFIAVGCAICHGGRNLGGRSSHVLGLVVPFVAADRGREVATGRSADRGVWKAPMLRHVAHTGPYLHDGSVATLDNAVRLMARHELGKELAETDVSAIVAMLRAVGDVDVDGLALRSSLAMEPGRGR
jgi:cytochrome c peroxidase